MTRFFKKLFIPHKHNHFRPHILRRRIVLFLAVFIFFLEGVFLIAFFLVIPESNLFSDILPLALVNFTNASRQENNLGNLATNPLLEKAAQLKADDMAAKGYFSHTTPEGKNPWYWLIQAGYKYDYAGENLAVNFLDSKDVVSAWLASPTHRANILAGYYTEIGIASARGLYQGKDAIFVVQFFGSPAKPALSLVGLETAQEPVSEQTQTKKTPDAPVAIEKVSGTISQKVPDTFNPATKAEKPKPVEEKAPPAENPAATPGAGQESDLPKQISPEQAESEVAGQSAAADQGAGKVNLSFFEKAASMPRSFLNIIYSVLAAIILLALALKIFIKIKIQHPPLIFNGVILLFILISVIYINQLLSQYGLVF